VATVLLLEDRRLALMPAVAAVKWQAHAPIFDPPREAAVIRRAADLGAPMGLDRHSVRALFELQAQLAREVQTRLHQRWSRDGFSSSAPGLTLAQLRPHLDELTVGLLQALYIATPALGEDAFAARYAAMARQQLRDGDWTDDGRRELLAELARIRRHPAPALQRIRASGLLLVGMTGDYEPFSLESGGRLSGSDVDLAQALASHLGTRAVFIRTTWSSLLEDLARSRFDLAMGGVSITPARAQQGAFSTSYVSGGKTILARCADARKYPDLAAVDQPDVRVIVNPGGTNEAYVRANIHRARIVVSPDNRAVFGALDQGSADVMITDDVEAELQIRHHRGLCRTYAGTLTQAQKAILMPRDPGLVAVVNRWLKDELASGEPARVLQTYLDR
jgi:cyclohexadienyl dehydratase